MCSSINPTPVPSLDPLKSMPPAAVRLLSLKCTPGPLTTLSVCCFTYRLSSGTWSGHTRSPTTGAYHLSRLSSHNCSPPYTFHSALLVIPCGYQAVPLFDGTTSLPTYPLLSTCLTLFFKTHLRHCLLQKLFFSPNLSEHSSFTSISTHHIIMISFEDRGLFSSLGSECNNSVLLYSVL